jgi:hypothetical protein
MIKADPAIDPRPAEAIRSALGLIAGEIPVSVYLFREAHALLLSSPDDLLDLEDGEVLHRFLGMFFDMATEILYEPFPTPPSQSLRGKPLPPKDLGRLIAGFDHTIFF